MNREPGDASARLSQDPLTVDRVRSSVDVVLRKFRLPVDVRTELDTVRLLFPGRERS